MRKAIQTRAAAELLLVSAFTQIPTANQSEESPIMEVIWPPRYRRASRSASSRRRGTPVADGIVTATAADPRNLIAEAPTARRAMTISRLPSGPAAWA